MYYIGLSSDFQFQSIRGRAKASLGNSDSHPGLGNTEQGNGICGLVVGAVNGLGTRSCEFKS